MRKLIAVAVLALALAGCGAANDDAKNANDPVTEPTSCDVGGDVPADEVECVDLDETPVKVPTFGDVLVFEPGVEVTLSTPTPYKPKGYTSVWGNEPKNATYLRFDVTVTNSFSEAMFEPGDLDFSVTSGGVAGGVVIDDRIASEATGSILPGRSMTFPYMIAVADPDDIVLDVDFDVWTPGGTQYVVSPNNQ